MKKLIPLKIVVGYPVGETRYYLGRKRISKHKAFKELLKRLAQQNTPSVKP